MIHLILKEFKINPAIISFKKEKLISTFLNLFLVGVMVFVSTYMFTLLYDKFDLYNASLPFAIVYMFVLSLLTLTYAVIIARKTFFNRIDQEVTVSRPIDTFSLTIAKTVYIFVILFIFELVLFGPHYVAYGVMSGRFPSYYYMVLISMFFHTIFDMSLAMLLMLGVEILFRYLKRHFALQMTLVIITMALLSFLYSMILNVFLNLLNNNNMAYLFSDSSIQLLRRLTTFLYPDVFISRSLMTINYQYIFGYLSISLGALIFANLVLYFIYPIFLNQTQADNKNKTIKAFKTRLPRHAILKKELVLLTRETDNLYSFTALIVIQPILSYMVILGINSAFTSGVFSIYSAILPNFIESVDILIMLLFSSLIALSGANLMNGEHKTIRIMKYLPYSITRQVYIKMAIIALATIVTNSVSLLLLIFFQQISMATFVFLLIATLLLNFSLIVLTFRSEILNFRKASNENAFASFVALIIPVFISGANVVLGLTFDLETIAIHAVNIALLLIIFSLVAIYLKLHFKRDIENLEVIN